MHQHSRLMHQFTWWMSPTRACLLLMHHLALFKCVWCIIYYTICWHTWQEHSMGLDFGTMNGFQGDFGGFYSIPLSLSGSTLPGPPINSNSTFTPETFGSELIAPSSFGYDLASSSYPSDDMLPDFSFTNMLNGLWDFSGIDLNVIELPISEEHSTSPWKRAAQAMLDPAKASELPLLPMPQGTSGKTAVSQPLPIQPTPSATAGPRPEPSFKLHGPQRHAVGSMPQKPIDPGKAPLLSTRNTRPQEAVPQTQTPPQSFTCRSVCQSNPSATRSQMPLEQITRHSWVPTKRQDSRLLVVARPSGWAIEAAEERKIC